MQQSETIDQARGAYLREQVVNEDPVDLIARVYRFAHVEAKRAHVAIAERRRRPKAQAIQRLLGALSLLQGSLNMEAGGEVAANLDRLYTYFIERITRANLHDDADAAAEVARHLGELASAWTTVAGRAAEKATR